MELMSWLSLIESLVIASVIYFIIKRYERLKKSPPGPWGLPFIGSLLTLNKENAILKIQEYKQTYGNIFSLNVGDFRVAVINDYKLVQEALKRDEFLGRPDFQSYTLRNDGFKNRGVLFSDATNNWREQRRFALRTLRDFGFGKQSMDGLLIDEVQVLIQLFKKDFIGKPVNLSNTFSRSVYNSLWYIISGKRFKSTDQAMTKMTSLIIGHLDKLTLFSPAHYYPWPAKYNLIRRGVWKRAIHVYATMKGMMNEVIEEHLDNDHENAQDFIDVYLHTRSKMTSTDSGFYGEEGLNNLNIMLLDLTSAGTETTSTTLLWAILFMTKDRKDRNPVREDRLRMPYLEAFTNEVHRKGTILPMSVYHKVSKDCYFNGYFFEKNTIVYPNIYDAHHDKAFWGDPEIFRPERFLDPTETQVVIKEALMPFSTGKRVCLGETLARESIFYFLCGLLQNFSFELDPSSTSNDTDIPKPNFLRAPYDFKVIMSPR